MTGLDIDQVEIVGIVKPEMKGDSDRLLISSITGDLQTDTVSVNSDGLRTMWSVLDLLKSDDALQKGDVKERMIGDL